MASPLSSKFKVGRRNFVQWLVPVCCLFDVDQLVYLLLDEDKGIYYICKQKDEDIRATFQKLNSHIEAPLNRIKHEIITSLSHIENKSPKISAEPENSVSLSFESKVSSTTFYWKFRLVEATSHEIHQLLVCPLSELTMAQNKAIDSLFQLLSDIKRQTDQFVADNGLRRSPEFSKIPKDRQEHLRKSLQSSFTFQHWGDDLFIAMGAALEKSTTSSVPTNSDTANVCDQTPSEDFRLLLQVDEDVERKKKEELKRKLDAEKEKLKAKKKKGLF